MGERHQETSSSDSMEEVFDPVIGDLSDDDLITLAPISSEKRRLAEKRRRAEQRLEEKRLRDELGDYDLELDDF